MDLHGLTTVNRPEWLHGVQRQFMRLPFSGSHHAICSGMQRNAPADAADAGPRGPILALPGGSVQGGQKPCVQGVATLCPSFAHVAQAANSGNKRPFLHFKAASFSTPSLRMMIWGTRSAQTGFALKAIPLPGQTCSVQLHHRHSPWRSSPSFLHPFVTPPRSTPSYPSYPSSVVVLC